MVIDTLFLSPSINNEPDFILQDLAVRRALDNPRISLWDLAFRAYVFDFADEMRSQGFCILKRLPVSGRPKFHVVRALLVLLLLLFPIALYQG